jgi:hypothetical protein
VLQCGDCTWLAPCGHLSALYSDSSLDSLSLSPVSVPQHDGALDDAMALAPHPSVGPAMDDAGVGASSAQHPLEATSAVPCAQGVAGVAAAAAASIPQRDGADDEELNSDDDDAEFAAEDEDEEKHTIYCQFEKVHTHSVNVVRPPAHPPHLPEHIASFHMVLD